MRQMRSHLARLSVKIYKWVTYYNNMNKGKACIQQKCPVYDQGTNSCTYISSNFADKPDYNTKPESIENSSTCLHPEMVDENGNFNEGLLKKAAKNWLSN